MNQWVADARALCEGATKGPWEVKTNRHPETTGELWGWIDGPRHHWCWNDKHQKGHADAKFIARARTLIPEMADEIERLQAERDRFKARAEAAEKKAKELECEIGWIRNPDRMGM